MLERFGFTGDKLTARLGRPLRWRAPPVPAAAAAALRAQRAAPRRADQRPRHRHPQRGRGLPRQLAGHAGRRLARPLLPRAGHRLDLGADGRRPDRACCPRGVDEYLEQPPEPADAAQQQAAMPAPQTARRRHEPRQQQPGSAEGDQRGSRRRRERAARKTIARIDKQLQRIAVREAELTTRWRANVERPREARRCSPPSCERSPRRRTSSRREWLEAATVLE